MSNEAAPRLIMEPTSPVYAYETIETVDTIAATMRHLVVTHVDQVALVTIALFFESDAKTISHHPKYSDPLASTHYLLNSLRPLVRRTDEVFLFGNTMHFLLPGASLQGGEIVQSRLWEALLWRIHNTTDRQITRPIEISIGHSAYPTAKKTIDECIEAATEAMLRSNFSSERSTRKTVARQAREAQQQAADDELPALARKLGIPYLSLLPKKPPAQVQQLVNARLAQELHCYPVGRERNILTVAMENPQDHAALERLQQVTGLIIFPVLTHPKALQTALEQLI
jgi:Type II secretion system (T2SS), protein E, N-terminal domain